ncbi:MAG: lytic transglycosylase [Thermodesulfobacterium geofontis]|uniref:Lytic transglycosylase n=1 Tax=Thermodesulfobacterium geofontis TaxID=1295609 RepID=A0A2N7PMQ0_9BACT|nr:MAG: lytic transglycosylase [Thermodesulfobacterium geofontis]
MSLILRIFIFILFFGISSVYADIYRCEDPQTGEVIFTNFKGIFPEKICQVYVREPKRFISKNNSVYYNIDERWFHEVAQNFSLDPALLKAIAKVESSFNPKAVSPKGALGLMQLMPTTAELVGVGNPFDPLESLRGGALYFKKLLEEFKDLKLALAAYNAGPEKVRIYRGIPPYSETQQYVRNVLYYYNLFRSSNTQ